MMQSLDDALGKKHKSKLQRDQEVAKSRPSTAAPPRRYARSVLDSMRSFVENCLHSGGRSI